MKPKSLHTILAEFYTFVLGRLVPMLAAWPVWSLRARFEHHHPVLRGNPRINPTARRCNRKNCRACRPGNSLRKPGTAR